ncbi:hypothetical protein GF389_05990 [Candidatus Dojkabacteria bacterium]|nr:hypothetical protein [Candidatus Dojkabacteria bacterium]
MATSPGPTETLVGTAEDANIINSGHAEVLKTLSRISGKEGAVQDVIIKAITEDTNREKSEAAKRSEAAVDEIAERAAEGKIKDYDDLKKEVASNADLIGDDKSAVEIRDKARGKIKERVEGDFLYEDVPQPTLIKDMRRDLLDLSSNGLIGARDIDQFIDAGVDAQKEKIESLKKSIEDLGADEVKRRAGAYNDEIKKAIEEEIDAREKRKKDDEDAAKAEAEKTALEEARDDPEIQGLAERSSRELMAGLDNSNAYDQSGIDGEIDDKIEELENAGTQFTDEEKKVLKQMMQERMRPFIAISETETYKEQGADIYTELKIDKGSLGQYGSAFEHAIDALKNMEAAANAKDTATKGKFERISGVQERDYFFKQAKMVAKYFVVAGLITGVGLGAAGGLGGVGAISPTVMNAVGIGVGGGLVSAGKLYYANNWGELGIDAETVEEEEQERNKQLAALDLEAAMRQIKRGEASSDLLGEIVSRKTGLDIKEVVPAVQTAMKTTDGKRLAEKLDYNNFGLSLAAA